MGYSVQCNPIETMPSPVASIASRSSDQIESQPEEERRNRIKAEVEFYMRKLKAHEVVSDDGRIPRDLPWPSQEPAL